MNHLRNLLSTPVEWREVPVMHEIEGKEVQVATMAGMPDAYHVNLQTMPPPVKELRAKAITNYLVTQKIPESAATIVTNDKNEPDELYNILLVAHYLKPGEDGPYSEYDVALIAKTQGLLFGKMYAAALQIVGNTDASQSLDPHTAAGLGNSSGADASAS